jgi:hypothetical protein
MKFKDRKSDIIEDKHLRQKIALLVVPVIAIVGLAVYAAASQNATEPPQSFVASRQNLSEISKDIANLNQEMSQEISTIQEAKKAGNTGKALQAIQNAKQTNTEAVAKAQSFSAGLAEMSKSLSGFTSTTSQALAAQAIATEISLTNEFITYTKLLDKFLTLLSASITNDNPTIENNIKTSLADINRKVDDINKLNQTFLQEIASFDKSL